MGQRRTAIIINGKVTTSELTLYTRNGKTIVRKSHSTQPRRNSRSQFVARQRMRHTTALWQMLKDCKPMFTGEKSTYAQFASLANSLPAVFFPRRGMDGASLLIPGIPISDGSLPKVQQHLGEVDGVPALISNLPVNDLQRGEVLRLYTMRQCIEGRTPRVRITMETLSMASIDVVDGCVALVDEQFSDDMSGWALVRVDGDRCSPQEVITRSTYYEAFATEEALLSAAETYGGLTQ